MGWTILAFLLIFGIVVVSHEFGHFIVAKSNGIKVVEFCIGMGPKIVGFNIGETTYALRLLPIGGACMFEGEDGLKKQEDEEENKENNESSLNDNEKHRSGAFYDAPIMARIATVVSGPLFNVLLAFVLSLILVVFCGSDTPTVGELMDGFPAQQAGIQEGDVLVKINNERIYLYREIMLVSMLNQGEPLDIVYERNGQQYETTLVPKFDEESGAYKMGIISANATEFKGWDVVKYGALEVRYWLKATFKSLQMLVTGKVTWKDVSGPVGIAQAIDTTIEETKSYGIPTVILNMINISVLLSVNLGVMNLLPIPALDGGRLLLLIIEAIRRKPLPTKYEAIINATGFVCLMILMVIVFFSDIIKLFIK